MGLELVNCFNNLSNTGPGRSRSEVSAARRPRFWSPEGQGWCAPMQVVISQGLVYSKVYDYRITGSRDLMAAVTSAIDYI